MKKMTAKAIPVNPTSMLGIASPLCMYGTIPIAASFSNHGMRHDWLAACLTTGLIVNLVV